MFEATGAAMDPGSAEPFRHDVELAREALAEDEFAEAWGRGRCLAPDLAVALALA